MLRTVVSEQQNDWDDHLPAALCAYRSTPHANTGVSPNKMVYGVEMTLPMDLMLGDTGPEQPEQECPYEYVEWIKDSLCRAHSRARKTLKTSAKRQRRGYGEPNRIVRFQRGEWVWRAYPRQGGKLRYTNRGPWLVLAKTGPGTYKIQRHLQADPDIVHMDKLMPYYPDSGERLSSWIETDSPVQYRDQEIQTSRPVLQDRELNIVDITPPVHDPVNISPPVPDPIPTAEVPEPGTDTPGTTEEPVEMEESFTTSPAQPEMAPVVLEALLELPSGPDQEFSGELRNSLDAETDPETCPADVSSRLQSTFEEPDGPRAEPEDEPTDECENPSPESPEIPPGSRSLVPLPRRGTRLRKQPERYTPVRRLQVRPATPARDGSSIWLFPNIGIAVTLSRSLSCLLNKPRNLMQTTGTLRDDVQTHQRY